MCSKLLRLVSVAMLATVFAAGSSVGFAKSLKAIAQSHESGDQNIKIKSTRRKAQKGNSSAQYNLGVAYHRGQHSAAAQ
jgi:hypothetical protein